MTYGPDLNKNYEGLPIPRLELRWTESTKKGKKCLCIYELVLPLKELDVRREDETGEPVREVLRVQMGEQEFSDQILPVDSEGHVQTPTALGAHARWDSSNLQLRAWAVYGLYETELFKEKHTGSNEP